MVSLTGYLEEVDTLVGDTSVLMADGLLCTRSETP